MRLSARMERYLTTDIGFSDFILLAVIPQTKTDAVILLAPRASGENTYCGLKYRGVTRWFGSVDELLDECVSKGYLGKVKSFLLKRRYAGRNRK